MCAYIRLYRHVSLYIQINSQLSENLYISHYKYTHYIYIYPYILLSFITNTMRDVSEGDDDGKITYGLLVFTLVQG